MIRRAEEKDIPAIMKLLHEVAEVHHHARPDLFLPDASKYTVPELAEILKNDGTPVFVFTDEADTVLGYVFCVLQEPQPGHVLTPVRTLYIDDLCVDENARGKHVGSALFRFAEEYARLLGCYALTLNVWEGNDSAKRFYESRGMRVQKTGMELILGEGGKDEA